MTTITAPPGMSVVPEFDGGWRVGGESHAFLSYAANSEVNWSDELESLHEEDSRTHFMDVWTRNVMLKHAGALAPDAVVADVGCSTGYLLSDLRAAHPGATLIGVDLIAGGLRKAHVLVPSALLLLADACDLPLEDGSIDLIVSANLLEHVPDDVGALREMRRVLKPGGRTVIVVPAGPSTYDYYDRFLGHERRYGRRELARKARGAGLEVLDDGYIASLLFPVFWLTKRWNRLRYGSLDVAAVSHRVAGDIARTGGSRVGALSRRLEERLGGRLPFGIRNVVVLQRGGA